MEQGDQFHVYNSYFYSCCPWLGTKSTLSSSNATRFFKVLERYGNPEILNGFKKVSIIRANLSIYRLVSRVFDITLTELCLRMAENTKKDQADHQIVRI
ncbi:hypothetical protein EGR_10663 [Echinococcus granulosus]|uniref:Uncharacterized protein n=1 Tax=Echinococcus granulosus TaxID=6210 RepID=W6ULX4_ECHGR|nr:hypothetical protein EGR_10663 [Echinococcus granulosus]EUB54479.1 hypothetical protein EGR_10663 [Echinococcus granulosus]